MVQNPGVAPIAGLDNRGGAKFNERFHDSLC
jgi:hypothetical protein